MLNISLNRSSDLGSPRTSIICNKRFLMVCITIGIIELSSSIQYTIEGQHLRFCSFARSD